MATAHMNVKGRTSLDGSGWAAGLRKMEVGTKGAAGRMAASMAGMVGGLFAVSALRSATMRMVAHADAIDKMAKRMESSTDTAQKFDFAASQNGATVEMVERSFMKTAQAMEGAKQGLNTYVRAFGAFGISMQQIKTSTPEEIFLRIADSIEKAGGALDKAKSLQDIMGRGGRQLVPAFVSGFAATAASAPDPIDEATIQKLARFNDELDRLKRSALPAAAESTGFIADVFEQLGIVFEGTKKLFFEPGKPGETRSGFEATFGEAAGEAYFGERGSARFMAADPRAAAILNKFINKPEQIDEPAEAATKAAAGFLKPSLALNSLQRIGAAVSQSADPIAIEKDNNVLLKRIANNTKDTARNTE